MLRRLIPAILLSAILTLAVEAQEKPFVGVTNPRVEYQVDPLGIDVSKPRFSWEINGNIRDIRQIAYELRVGLNPDRLTDGDPPFWTTGKVVSGASGQVAYSGPALESGKRYYWTVRIWDNQNHITDWAPVSNWEMGLLAPADWKAEWIEPQITEDAKAGDPCPMLRKSFKLKKEIRSARLYITSHGLYELQVNGKKPNDWLFTPGWTSYKKHLQYQTYDLTKLLVRGENAIGVMLGNGWYRGDMGWSRKMNLYGNQVGLLAQLEVVYADGSKAVITTDKSWKFSSGPILFSEIYHGETYDARLEVPGWSAPAFDDGNWKPVMVKKYDLANLRAQTAPPVRCMAELTPVSIFKAPNGDTLVDMGQNMVGWARLKVSGKPGTLITVRHSEVLDQSGNMYYANLRAAKQTNNYYLKGSGPEMLEPHFTFQGFRYLKVSGLTAMPAVEDISGIVIHSDMPEAGEFTCSDPMINQLQHNIQWGLMGNFLDVPTDCPQRDERLGWTGDAQVFSPTACFNRDAATFYTKWLRDLAFDQREDGRIPHVIPDILNDGGSTGWADAGLVVPWNVYREYGDTRILEQQYESMKKWIAYMKDRAGDRLLWTNGNHFGDWLAFATTRSDYPGATTDKDLIATAYFAWSTHLVAKIAGILGKTDDASLYGNLAEEIRKAFRKEYMTPNGRLASNTQTAYVLALTFDLVPGELRDSVAARFAADVRAFGHITTGFIGASLVNPVLSAFGYDELAYKLLMRKEYPGYLYPITKGATTIWERWDGIKADGSFQDAGMNSFNHYAYGAIGKWMYSRVAGISEDPVVPAYRKFIVHPVPGGGITWVRCSHKSMFGTIQSDWKLDNGRMIQKVKVPANTEAEVYVKTDNAQKVIESGQPAAKATGVSFLRMENGYAVFRVGSGSYEFTTRES